MPPTATATAPTTADNLRPIIDFDQLVRTHWSALYKYAYRLAGDAHTAEDLVQDSLLRAWRARQKLKEPGAVKGWLKTIVRRENARRFERIQPRESAMPTEEVGAERKTYDTSTEAFVLRRAIAAASSILPRRLGGGDARWA